MSKDPSPDHDSAQPKSGHSGSEPSYLRWVFIGGGIAFAGLLAVSLWWPNLTERTKFFIGTLWVIVTAFAVIAQALIYQKQRDIMRQQWQTMDESLKRTDKVIETMTTEAAIMAGQAEIMRQSFLQTRQLVEQNERGVKAAENSATTAKEAFDIGECPHFGVRALMLERPLIGGRPKVVITLVNGGRTPARHVRIDVGLSLGRVRSNEDIWDILHTPDIYESFFAANEEKTITYDQAEFIFTPERIKAIVEDADLRLFIFGTVHYTDFRNKPQSWSFWTVYDPDSGKCYDYET